MPRHKKQKDDLSTEITDPVAPTVRIRRKAAQNSLDKIKIMTKESMVFTSPESLSTSKKPVSSRKKKKAEATDDDDDDDANADNDDFFDNDSEKVEATEVSKLKKRGRKPGKMAKVVETNDEKEDVIEKESVEDEVIDNAPKKKGRKRKAAKKVVKEDEDGDEFIDDTDDGDEYSKPKKKGKKRGKAAKEIVKEEEDDDDSDGDGDGESADDERHPSQIRKKKKDLQSNSIASLKNMCRRNDLVMSGSKSDLIERVADAMVNGPPSRCPNCFGGRLHYDSSAKVYYCKGFYDEDHFHHCHYQSETVSRETWKDE